jgi:hypothetical protein
MKFPLETLVEKYNRPWREFRETVGSRHTVLKKAKEQGLTAEQADKYAIRCGFHPIEVWGFKAWIEEQNDEKN